MKFITDPVIVLTCLLLLAVGYIFGMSAGILIEVKLTDWLTSFGTIGAVIAAMWAVNENHRRDTYKLKVSATIVEKPKYFTMDGFKGRTEVSNIPKVTLRVVNTGTRPITLEALSIRDKFGVYSKRLLQVYLEPQKGSFPVLQPGAFYELVISQSEAGECMEQVMSKEYFIIDALEKYHKASTILNSKNITIVQGE
ncbi:MAG: hypothetical protein CML20_10365 [Rheinheimera sp.]|uniref:hypothetical protein n=1 Tax=Arsukibacterium sp. UBA3155 TaxID=1946058 RepID=UPI000C8ECC2A|nr:hypothetical protein [Arsukibacterium sp. UBA3155]MAD75176.1 hypothetical protein [Rheinheimera sp.]|tara:strand:+ start:18219 stop:18806 length:588 start_codon:yes stop_codon:yes gene_type:complete